MTRNEFKTKYPGVYTYLHRNEKLDMLYPLLEGPQHIKWNENLCRKEALKYETRTQWSEHSESSYRAAHRLGIMDKICSHMTRHIVNHVTNLDTKKVYKNVKIAGENINRHPRTIANAINRSKTAGGFHWAYCDKDGNVID